MSADQDIEELRERHHALDVKIEQEIARPAPDDLKISTMKKEKLRIKDQILVLEAGH